jgi:cyclic pyranopterin phosphate synthase
MFTHLDQNNQPTMVDVSNKHITPRMARARCELQLPPVFAAHRDGEELRSKKGPVFQTAVIAGTMAAKRTHEFIPFCHQLPLESVKFEIRLDEGLRVTIDCTVKTTARTGVEMEALQGAMSAALTVYDMCKAISHEIVIKEARLLVKTGGKATLLDRPTYGLVLTGGRSERMGEPKALMHYHGEPQAKVLADLLRPYCTEVFLSAREAQWQGTPLEGLPTISDAVVGSGPMVGILSAMERHPEANWIVLACDLVRLRAPAIEALLTHYDPDAEALAFRNSEIGFPEPLCTLYTPHARGRLQKALAEGITCPVKVLRNARVRLIDQTEGVDLTNVNTPEESAEARHEIS